jgi:hypothetical protein
VATLGAPADQLAEVDYLKEDRTMATPRKPVFKAANPWAGMSKLIRGGKGKGGKKGGKKGGGS